MDIRKLQRAIVDGLEDVKAANIVVLNTEHLSPLFERVIIASGTSNRQTKALASSVRGTVKERGLQVLRTEGEDNGEWIIVDCGAAVAHIMQPAIRDYYHLEEIWGGKPVKMKIDTDAQVRLPKAETPQAKKAFDKSVAYAAAQASAPRTAGGKAAPAKSAKKPAARPAASKKAPAGKAPAKKAPARKTVTRTVGLKKAAPAKKAAPKKTVRRG